jgi:hypothetical protein
MNAGMTPRLPAGPSRGGVIAPQFTLDLRVTAVNADSVRQALLHGELGEALIDWLRDGYAEISQEYIV